MNVLSDSRTASATSRACFPSRLFYALWPDAKTAQELSMLQEGLAGRHTHPNDMHLTLAFVGVQPDENLPVLNAILRDLLLPASFQLNLMQLNSFENIKVSWVGPITAPEPLMQLWRALGDALDQHGIWWDKKIPFRPHVTLARKVAVEPRPLAEPIYWQTRKVVLAGSVPGTVPGGGGKYRILAERKLL